MRSNSNDANRGGCFASLYSGRPREFEDEEIEQTVDIKITGVGEAAEGGVSILCRRVLRYLREWLLRSERRPTNQCPRRTGSHVKPSELNRLRVIVKDHLCYLHLGPYWLSSQKQVHGHKGKQASSKK
jgi:hypothetical protein